MSVKDRDTVFRKMGLPQKIVSKYGREESKTDSLIKTVPYS